MFLQRAAGNLPSSDELLEFPLCVSPSYLVEFLLEWLEKAGWAVEERLVHGPEAGDEALLLLPDPPEAAVEPLADGELGHLLLDHVLQLLASQQLLQLQRFSVNMEWNTFLLKDFLVYS